MKRRTLMRVSVVLLAAGLVIAVTGARFSPYDWAKELAAQEAAAKGQMPAAGAEAVLRRLIADPPRRPPRPGTDLARLGPLKSITYLGWFSDPPIPGLAKRIDDFRVTYRNGTLFWRIGLDKKGAVDFVAYWNPEPMTPAQTIAFFSPTADRPWGFAMMLNFLMLLVIAAVARYALRIRL